MENGSNAAVVAAQNITRRFGSGDTAVDALRGVSLEIGKGKLTAIMGPSGSGKSTLMHLMGALDTPTAGRILFEGTDLAKLTDKQRSLFRRDRVGFVFQAFNLLPTMTAAENVALPLLLAGVSRSFVHDFAAVDPVLQHQIERASRECLAT